MVDRYIHKDVVFSVSVSDIKDTNLQLKTYAALNDIFKGFIKSNDKTTAFSFKFTDHIDSFINEKEFVRAKDIRIGNHQTYFKDTELDYLINHNDPFSLIININNNESLKSSLRIFNKAFKNNIELQISIFYYRVFLIFSQLWNIKNNCSYIHAASVEIDGGSILFSADSGVGKSALLFKLSEDKKARFIADDLTIISNKSESFYQGRCLSVKPYHLKFSTHLSNKLEFLMAKIQKLQWRILKDNRLTWRIAPSDLFDDVCNKTEIKRVIHLCNHSKEDFIIKDISSKDLIQYALPILSNEFFLANHKLNTLASLPDSIFISPQEMLSITKDIFRSAFNNKSLKLVSIPYRSSPNDLYKFLQKEGCLN